MRRALARNDPEQVIQLCWSLFNRPLFLRILDRGIPEDQAEDVLQEVFALLQREYERVRGPRLQGWLWTVTDYECRRHHTARRRTLCCREAAAGQVAASGARSDTRLPDILVDQRREVAAVLEFLRQLSSYESTLLETALIGGATTQEVLDLVLGRFGQQLDAMQLARQRHRLRQRLKEHLATWRPAGTKGNNP
ncbi:MAG: hypothetical protein ABIO70_08060 [Pseudomonadota bacterium]